MNYLESEKMMGDSWRIIGWNFWKPITGKKGRKFYFRANWDSYGRYLMVWTAGFGWCGNVIIRQPILIALPPSAKMIREHANVCEAHHPSRGGRTVNWMRHLADITEKWEGLDG